MKHSTKEILLLLLVLVSSTLAAQISVSDLQITHACDGTGGSITMGLSAIPKMACLTEASTGSHRDLTVTSSQLEISNLPPGFYTLHLVDGDEIVGGTRFTIADCETTPDASHLQVLVYMRDNRLLASVTGGRPGYHYKWTRQGMRVGNNDHLNSPHPGVYEVTVMDQEGRQVAVTYIVSSLQQMESPTRCTDLSTVFLRGEERALPIGSGNEELVIIDHYGKGKSTIIDGQITYQAPKGYSGKGRACLIRYQLKTESAVCDGIIRIFIPPESTKIKK